MPPKNYYDGNLLIDIEGTHIFSTEAARQVSIEDVDGETVRIWLPKSLMSSYTEQSGEEFTAQIPQWLALKHNLT